MSPLHGRRARSARGAVALVLVGGLLLAASFGAGAQETGAARAEVAALAVEAIDDDAALAELRSITEVDGAPVDLDAATAELGDARTVRLQALADAFGGASDPSIDPEAARDDAARVLEDDKFDEQRLPRPFKGLLEWLGDRLRPVGRIFEPFGDLLDGVPGGSAVLIVVVGAALGVGAWVIASRRGGAVVATSGAGLLVDLDQDPAELDRAADDAERSGDLGAAVRLRYEAGLVRLVRAGRVELHPDTTVGVVARQLGDATVADLTATFEAVVYGGRPATPADVDAARSGWAGVLGAGAKR